MLLQWLLQQSQYSYIHVAVTAREPNCLSNTCAPRLLVRFAPSGVAMAALFPTNFRPSHRQSPCFVSQPDLHEVMEAPERNLFVARH